MTASGAYFAKTDQNFQMRVEYFVVAAAIASTTESVSGSLHAQRVALAKNILNNSALYAPKFGLAVMSNSTLLAATDLSAIPDGDIQFVVNSIYNSFLGL